MLSNNQIGSGDVCSVIYGDNYGERVSVLDTHINAKGKVVTIAVLSDDAIVELPIDSLECVILQKGV